MNIENDVKKFEEINPFSKIDYLSDDLARSDYSNESSFSDCSEGENSQDNSIKRKIPRVKRHIKETDSEDFEKAISLFYEIKPRYFDPQNPIEDKEKKIEISKKIKNNCLTITNPNWDFLSSQILSKAQRKEFLAQEYIQALEYFIHSQEDRCEERKQNKKKEKEQKKDETINNSLLKQTKRSPSLALLSPNSPSNAKAVRWQTSINKLIKLSQRKNAVLGKLSPRKSIPSTTSRHESNASCSSSNTGIHASIFDHPSGQIYRISKSKIPSSIPEKEFSYFKNYLIRQPYKNTSDFIFKGERTFEGIKSKIIQLKLFEKWKADQ